MDEAYNQHSSRARRQNRSSTNLNHLSLAPLTTKLPISDSDELPDGLTNRHLSYIEGKSAPATPGIITRSPSRGPVNGTRPLSTGTPLPKSKSSTHLVTTRKQTRSGTTTPGRRRREDVGLLSNKDRSDSDWLLRAGILITSETRESKGQAWLASRASSTSLTGQRSEEYEAFERELAIEREMNSRMTSRRGSNAEFDGDDEFSPMTTRNKSRPTSRYGSRSHSRVGSKAQIRAADLDGGEVEGYFDSAAPMHTPGALGPDFINMEEREEEDGHTDDEAIIRRLVKDRGVGIGNWVERLTGWQLFAVDEDGELDDDEDEDEEDTKTEASARSRASDRRQLEELSRLPDSMPLPSETEGGWKDAAWLLSVASKVIL